MRVKTESELRKIYDQPKPRARDKVIHRLEKHSINFIQSSPFFILSTCSQDGNMDASPRGGAPGFVKMINDSTIVFPDSKGNNRLDSLTNIIQTEKVGCLFFIPGIDETLRLNGKIKQTQLILLVDYNKQTEV